MDNLKFRIDNQPLMQRLHELPFLEPTKSPNNTFKSFAVNPLTRLDFRKAFEDGQCIGYSYLDLSISPHYHFNNYLHNGNDFSPIDCINSVYDILYYFGISMAEFGLLKVVNFEFGINLIPKTDVRKIVNGLIYYKKNKPFKVRNFAFNKRSEATSYKTLKAYAKGLQFEDEPRFGIDANTFRFEIKSKQSKFIETMGIKTAHDVLKSEVYEALYFELLREWSLCLVIHLPAQTNIEFWKKQMMSSNRNNYNIQKKRYYSRLPKRHNFHAEIMQIMEDKINRLLTGATSTQKSVF